MSPLGQLEGSEVLVVQLVDVSAPLDEDLADLDPAAAHGVMQRGRVPARSINYMEVNGIKWLGGSGY